jgi:hypothetical protein
MTCTNLLADLACRQRGVGFLSCDWRIGMERLRLMSGEGDEFPQPVNGQTFWVDVGTSAKDCGCCARFEVIDRRGDELVLKPGQQIECNVLACGARVAYATSSREHLLALIESVGINAQPPLHYDCKTRRLWIDCGEMHDMLERPCAT